jgi:predicted TIM-barrel fold metal-dependent hydrolase
MIFDCGIVFGTWRYSDIDTSLENVRAILKKHGIGKALAISSRGIFYDDFEGNDETLKVCRENKDLYPLATVCLSKFVDIEKEIGLRKSQGFLALRLFNEYQGVDFDGLVFKRFSRILEKSGMPLILKGTDFNLRSYTDRIAKALADVDVKTIVLDTSGYSLTDTIEAARFNKNIYFGTRLFNTPDSIEIFCEEVDPKRLVLATGIPFYYGSQSIYRIQTALISDDMKEGILSKNLIKLLEDRK